MGRSEGSVSDRVFFTGSVAALTAIVAVITVIASVFSLKVWMVGDTNIFWEMAGLIVQGGTPYLDYVDPKPPLIFFTLALPVLLGQTLIGSFLLVGLANLISAVAVLTIAWSLYGRNAGLLAGTLTAINLAWAENYFVITEPFTLAFILLSTCFLIRGPDNLVKKYVLAGICAGLAIGYKQYALLLVPVTIIFMFRKKEHSGFLPYAAGVLLPLVIIFGFIFVVYGVDAGVAALHWSFGVAGSYVTEGVVEGVPAYRIDDPVIAVVWLALGMSLFTSLILLALGSLMLRKLTINEEFFLLAGAVFAATLLIRPFLHYWALALPFIVLLGVRLCSSAPFEPLSWFRQIGRRTEAIATTVVYGSIYLVSSMLSALLIEGRWRPLDIQRFYGLADIILAATSPYFGHVPEPSLFSIQPALPEIFGHQHLAGLLITGLICLCSALLMARTAARLYGKLAGFFAGLLFAVCTAWAMGFMLLSDAVAILLIVLSLSFLASGYGQKFSASGLCLGAAIVFKPLLLIILPAAVLAVYFGEGRREAISMSSGVLLLPVLALVVFVITSGFPATPGGVSVSFIEPVAGRGYLVSDQLIAMINIVMASTLISALLIFSVALLLSRPSTAFEKYLLAAGALMLVALFARQFTHYWFAALPFLVILASAGLGVDRE